MQYDSSNKIEKLVYSDGIFIQLYKVVEERWKVGKLL